MRGGDVLTAPAPSPPAPPPPPAGEPPPAVRALGSVRSGDFRGAASYLTVLPAAELEAAGVAARDLAGLVAAIIRVRRPGPVPPGFSLCLGCRLGDCPTCGDSACARYPAPPPRADDGGPPGDLDVCE